MTGFLDTGTNAVCHVVRDPGSTGCAVFDSILDMASGTNATTTPAAMLAEVARHGLDVEWSIETPVHAAHLSAMPHLAKLTGTRIHDVHRVFGEVFSAGTGIQTDGSRFDTLFADGDTFCIDGLDARVIHTLDHAPLRHRRCRHS